MMMPETNSTVEATATQRPYVVLDGVAKSYGTAPPVLSGISLTVNKGEFVSLIGPSGCGKSTILKLVAGLALLSAGQITVEGMTPDNAREIVSFIFQDATLLPWRTVMQNVELGLELERIAKFARRKKVEALLELVGLTHAANSYPRQLSGGMKMRASIARALSTKPSLLLMDEPFGALDEISRDRLNEEILRLQAEQGWTALFVTHSVAEAVFLSSRILVLAPHPGRIAQEISVDLPYPRTANTRMLPAYDELVARVSKTLRGVHGV
jgi:NitT/TauT family transport system ATP-binding protein